MNIDLRQHRVASGIICLISVWVAYLSFTQSPSEAYVFPRIIAVVLVFTAAITFIKAIMGRTKVGEGITLSMAKNMLPGVVISFVFLFWAAKFLGFYFATLLATFSLLCVYDPKPNNKINTWLKRLAIVLIYIAVMYVLFALVLKVYTPRGLLI